MFKSYYRLKITGKDVKRFLKQLYNLNIFFEEIEFKEKELYIKVDKDNYKKIKKIKTIYKIEIINLYGISKIKDIINKYNIFFICIIIGIILLNILSNMIFIIEIDTDDKKIKEIVNKELEIYNIKRFSFNKDYNERKEIIEKILKNNKETIEWIEIEKIGTKYIVRVEERIIKNKKENCSPRNIIAKRDGLIININSSTGEIKKSINDYVKKGDVIISGIITKNDEEKNKVCASGKVYAETWYQVTVEVPYNYKEIIYTKDYKKNISITFLNKRITLFKDYNNYLIKEKSISNKILPLKISLEKQQRIIKIDHIYTNEELDLKALEISKEKLKHLLKNNSTILLEKKLKTIPKNSTIEVVIFFKVKEDITAYQDIIIE